MKKILLSVLAILALAGSGMAQTLPSYVPANGLVGWWPFNGNANDESGNGHHAIPQGAQLSSDRFSNPNGSYSFIGQSGNGVTGTYMEMPNVGINMMNEFSISIWVNEQSILGDGEAYIAFGDANSSIEIRNWSGILGFFYGNIQGVALPFNGQNNWKMYSMTRNNNELRAYINDSLVGTLTNLSSVDITNSGNYLARHKWGPNPLETSTRFTGSLDDIAIYNRALTQQEITGLYQGANTTTNCPTFPASLAQGLVGYWPFCGNALDESGNNNHGTVNGATLTTDRFGNAGSAFSLDGISNRLDLPQSLALNGRTKLSISSWARGLNGGNIFGHWANNSQPTGPIGLFYGVLGDSKKINISTNGGEGFLSVDTINPQNWNMITLVFDGIQQESSNKLKLFVNGIPMNLDFFSFGAPSALGLTANSTYLGARGVGPITPSGIGGFFNGSLDDIAIWNRALTPQEITQLYNQGICQTSITVTDTLLIHTGITSYNPVAYGNTLKVWPNPGNQDITLDAGNLSSMQGWKYKVANTLGQTVVNETAISQQQTMIDLSNWGGNGIYYLHLINPQGHAIEIKKIVLAP